MTPTKAADHVGMTSPAYAPVETPPTTPPGRFWRPAGSGPDQALDPEEILIPQPKFTAPFLELGNIDTGFVFRNK